MLFKVSYNAEPSQGFFVLSGLFALLYQVELSARIFNVHGSRSREHMSRCGEPSAIFPESPYFQYGLTITSIFIVALIVFV